MSSFATPADPSGGIDWATINGSLLLIEVLAQEHEVTTVHGKTDPVRANVHVIDGAGVGDSYADTLIFPKILITQTKGQVGQKVLGRLGQGQAKPGQSAPWILNAASAEDVTKAEAWVQQHAPAVTTAAPPF